MDRFAQQLPVTLPAGLQRELRHDADSDAAEREPREAEAFEPIRVVGFSQRRLRVAGQGK